MKITNEDIKAIKAAVRDMMGRRTVEVGVRAGTINSTRWNDDDDDLEHCLPIREIVGLPKETGMVLDLYIYDADGRLENLDAKWHENQWDVYDPFRNFLPLAPNFPCN